MFAGSPTPSLAQDPAADLRDPSVVARLDDHHAGEVGPGRVDRDRRVSPAQRADGECVQGRAVGKAAVIEDQGVVPRDCQRGLDDGVPVRFGTLDECSRHPIVEDDRPAAERVGELRRGGLVAQEPERHPANRGGPIHVDRLATGPTPAEARPGLRGVWETIVPVGGSKPVPAGLRDPERLALCGSKGRGGEQAESGQKPPEGGSGRMGHDG